MYLPYKSLKNSPHHENRLFTLRMNKMPIYFYFFPQFQDLYLFCNLVFILVHNMLQYE